MEDTAKELKKPYEFLSKNERLLLGFLQDCPKQYTEIIGHLGTLRVEKKTANNVLKRLERARKIFRIKKAENGRIFYRLNDFPDNINAVLIMLDTSTDTDPWTRPFIDKLRYNIITQFPKYDLKQITKATIIETQLIYQQSPTAYQQFLNQLMKNVGENKPQFSLKSLSQPSTP